VNLATLRNVPSALVVSMIPEFCRVSTRTATNVSRLGAKTRDGDKAACPLCRKEFLIPDGGLNELPKNFFLTKLLRIKDLSLGSHEAQLCDVCLSVENVSTDKTAKMFCLDCQQKQCSTCHLSHSMFKQFQSHKTVNIRDKITEDELWPKFPPPYCEKHRDEYIKIYCFDCESVSCMMCYIEKHNSHKCSDISKVSEEFRAETTQHVESLNRCIDNNRATVQSLENDKTLFSNRIGEIETEVCKKAQQLHDVIERHKQVLLNELDEIKKNRNKEVDNVRSEIEQHTSMVASLQIYMKQMNQKGSACDVVREANSLKSRFSELLNEATTVEKSMESLGSVDVSFAPEDSKWKDDFNAIGKVTAQRARPVVLNRPSKHSAVSSNS
jgi:hypothetical protein